MKWISLLLGAAVLAICTQAKATVINFDDLPQDVAIDDFYSGLGVYFEIGNWITVSGFGATSIPNLGYSFNTTGYMNVVGGFIDSLHFSYGTFGDALISIYDGLNGTGSLLASVILAANDPFEFDTASIGFSGVAHSFKVQTGDIAQFGWDDVTFTSASVPEPATLALFGFGLASLGASRIKRQRPLNRGY